LWLFLVYENDLNCKVRVKCMLVNLADDNWGTLVIFREVNSRNSIGISGSREKEGMGDGISIQKYLNESIQS
jgi:hypothetical protein